MKCPKCDCCQARGVNKVGLPNLCVNCYYGINRHKKMSKPTKK